MGRLTLNVLLSFAQFERELIGERIRDKIAASKKKGMWMGGVPPLGYRAQDHKLIVVDSEAEVVRALFRRYAELGSVRLLQEELKARGITSRSLTSASGHVRGGKPFSRGALYLLLHNRIYRGEIVHNGQSHLGEHKPIIDRPLWDAVQAQLASNAAERNSGTRTRQPSLLAGMLFDGDGNRMTPTHAVKNDTRYRYYVSRPLITNDQTEGSAGLRIPAVEIEQLVTSRVRQWLLDPGSICQATSTRFADPATPRRLAARAQEIGKRWPELPMMRQRAVLTALIDRIAVGVDQIDIRLCLGRLGTPLDVAATPLPSVTDDEIQILSIPVRRRRSGSEIRMLIDGTDPSVAARPDARLIKLLLKARRFSATLVGSDGVPFVTLAEREGVSRSYFTRVVRQLSRPGHRPSYPRRAPAARSDRRQAARALPSAAGLARSAHRARFCLSPIRTQSTHGIATATNITGAAVPESDPTEILSPVGAISPRHARLCRPRWLLRPATVAEKRGFSTVTGEFRRETRLSAGGKWIRTFGSARQDCV